MRLFLFQQEMETMLDDLVDTIFKYLTYGPMFYDEDTVTDQPMRQISCRTYQGKSASCS